MLDDQRMVALIWAAKKHQLSLDDLAEDAAALDSQAFNKWLGSLSNSPRYKKSRVKPYLATSCNAAGGGRKIDPVSQLL